MAHWSPDDIPWSSFDAAKVHPGVLSLVKTACMVERNGLDYARYLCEVFPDDAEFQQVAHRWADEEVQHGEVLRRWAQLADPEFDFEKSFSAFTTGYQLPTGLDASVRGSHAGELIARCMVETGTSLYYTAIREYTDEPVLQAICAKITADELRHYKLFYTYLQSYLKKDMLSKWQRLRIGLGRIAETSDDELSYAFFAAHHGDKAENRPAYDRKLYQNKYFANVLAMYRRDHVDKMMAMVFKAVGLKPHTWLQGLSSRLAWVLLKLRVHTLKAHVIA